MAWVNWNLEQPLTGSQFWIKDELGNVVSSRAYIENNIVYLALDGDDEVYVGQISEWTYELGN